MPLPRRLAGAAAVAAAAGALAAPSGAHAATTAGTSTNWSGYAVTGATYRTVTGAWTVPTITCTAGETSYSANWVGLGGFKASSQALEQTGTEADCVNGKAKYASWYELVPDVSHDFELAVHAGDEIASKVTVKGHRATLRLTNRTTGRTVKKTVRAAAVDRSSAEWVVEAPSLCSGASADDCTVADLADFGTTSFSSATATTVKGHKGTVDDARWTTTALTLASDVSGRSRAVSAGDTATPTALTAGGTGFSVAYAAGAVTVPTRPVQPGQPGGPGGW